VLPAEEPSVTEVGLREQLIPAGEEANTDRLTVPENPLRLFRLIAVDGPVPRGTEIAFGFAVMLKSKNCTVVWLEE
jgi:hypothetical protein